MKFLKGFLFGAIIGGTYTLLTAKRSGKETRQQLIQQTKEWTESINDVAQSSIELQQSIQKLVVDGATIVSTFSQELSTILEHYQETATQKVTAIQQQLQHQPDADSLD